MRARVRVRALACPLRSRVLRSLRSSSFSRTPSCFGLLVVWFVRAKCRGEIIPHKNRVVNYYRRLVAVRYAPNGDLDGNGCVDDADLLQVLFAFGQQGADLAADLNGDAIVDDADLLQVLFAFGEGC